MATSFSSNPNHEVNMSNPFDVEITKEDLVQKDFVSGPREPYIGPAYLISVDRDPTPGKGDNEYETLNYHWKLGTKDEEGNVAPTDYRFVEFYPDPSKEDFQSKGKNLLKRIVYVLTYYVGEDKAVETVKNWKDWDDLRDKVIKTLGTVNTKKKKVRVKLIGNAYQMRVDFPKYIGFISDENSDKQVEYNKDEMEKNAEYMRALKEGVSKNRGNEGVPPEEAEDAPLQF
jgi:hypothetical protein